MAPAAIEDCVAAYRSLLDAGTDPASIVFAGDSAGGGLAVTTSLAARGAGLPHVFQAFAGVLGEAEQALERAALFLTQHLGAAAPIPAAATRSEYPMV